MPLGYNMEPRLVNLNDTADLEAVLYDDDGQPRDPNDLVSVSFTVQAPDQVQTIIPGEIDDTGQGSAIFNETSQAGQYAAVATFTDVEGRRKSVRCDFEVINPFAEINPSASFLVATQVWARIEDCFDADEEGPWLRDMTQNVFNKEKMESFMDLALFDINNLNPPTSLSIVDFVFTDPNTGEALSSPNLPVLVQGMFLVCLRHLMTSYVEQPNPMGAQIAWQDRRDYLQRWATVYQIEFQAYDRMVKLYKRQFLGLGQTAGLIYSKAGRLVPAPMRAWSVMRGYW